MTQQNEVQEAIEEPDTPVDAPEPEGHEAEAREHEQPEKAWDEETEQEARFLGWKSPDEWKGDVPPGYIDNPTDFIERLERSTPFRKMRERAEAAETRTQEELRRVTAAIEAGHKREIARQQAEYQRQIEAISTAQRKAAEEGDVERFDSLEQQRKGMKPPEPEAPQADSVDQYADDHPWINDPIMRQTGSAAIDQALRAGVLSPGSDAKTQIEYAEQQVKKYFPHLFKEEGQEQKPAPKPKVDGGGLASGRRQSGFESLPKEAREEFKRQVSKGVFEDTKEDREFYFNEYQNG